MNHEGHLDVLIVGGGPAGAAAAIALAQLHRCVVVLDRRHRPGWTIGETLPPAANPLLQRLGVYDRMQQYGHLPSYGVLSSWGSPDLVERDFICDPFGPGWQIDRERFETQLANTAKNCGASIHYRSQLLSIEGRCSGHWTVNAAIDGQARRLSPAWIVDATGRQCRVARALGLRRAHVDHLVGVYATAGPSDATKVDGDTRTLIEAVTDGWWYTARTPNGRRTIAWLTDGVLLRGMNWRTPGGFAKLFETTRWLSPLLKDFGYQCDQPRCISASSSRLNCWTGDGWLAIGDAALSMDPLSSQGLFHAIASGIVAAEAIATSARDKTSHIQEYSDHLAVAWQVFLNNRRDNYRMETRWGQLPFWRYRQVGPSP